MSEWGDKESGAGDGTRTRDLRRDRPGESEVNSTGAPNAGWRKPARKERNFGTPSKAPEVVKANAAGVGARGAAGKQVAGEKRAVNKRAHQPARTVALTAVLDHNGVVLAVIAGRVEARAFLFGGHA